MKRLIATAGTLLLLAVSGAAFAHGDEHGQCSFLPPEKKEILHHAMHEGHEKNKALFERKHKLHEELHAILAEPKFDKEEFLEKHKELQEIENRMQTNMVKSFASVAGKFTPEEREKLARILHHHGHHGEWHHEHVNSDDWHHPPTRATRERNTESPSESPEH